MSYESLREANLWARAQALPLFAIGGGSNVVASDAGFDGVIVKMAGLRGIEFHTRANGETWVTAAAGEPWDAFVDTCVGRDLGGIECLAGIPGLVGATPIQNVGAYGQEVSETIRQVRVLDRASDAIEVLDAASCGFGYRESRFRRAPDQYVVLSVTFALRTAGVATIRYPELAAAIATASATTTNATTTNATSAVPSLSEVSATVRTLRRGKSMVLDPADENRRSVGSFFTNPIVSVADAEAVCTRALAAGLVDSIDRVPRFPTETGAVKLSAGWLIERAGFQKGLRRGAVGLSSRHALALVHHGGGTTAELLSLAHEIRDGVARTFGVTLSPEPILLGVDWG